MSEYDDGRLAGQRVIALFSDLGSGAELERVRATGVPSIEEVESVLQQVWARSSSSQPETSRAAFGKTWNLSTIGIQRQ